MAAKHRDGAVSVAMLAQCFGRSELRRSFSARLRLGVEIFLCCVHSLQRWVCE